MILRAYLILAVICIAGCGSASGNPAPEWNYNDDFIRSIIPEMMFTENTALIPASSFKFENNMRYGQYSGYWDDQGVNTKLTVMNSNFTDFIGIRYGLSPNTEISTQMALYWLGSTLHSGYSHTYRREENKIGDILFSIKVNPFLKLIEDERYAVNFGLKLPTGGDDAFIRSSFDSVDLFAMGCYELLFEKSGASVKAGYTFTSADGDYNDPGNVLFFIVEIFSTPKSYSKFLLGLRGYRIAETYYSEISRFSLAPRMILFIPKTSLEIGGGLLLDIHGKNTLHGTTLLLNLNLNSTPHRP